MRLRSDFWDYYDHQFSSSGPEFFRLTRSGPDKRSQFQILKSAGYLVPPHGLVRDVADYWWEEESRWVREVVAYDDPFLHRGEGKRVLRARDYRWDGCLDLLQKVIDLNCLFCSAFLGCSWTRPSVSLRLLSVGPHRFWLEYRSETDWRSNCGDCSVSVIGVEKNAGRHPVLTYPLWAIDFVLGKEMYAIDLNIAPGIRGSGVERYLSPRDVYLGIESFF